jgi:hypothetical protein
VEGKTNALMPAPMGNSTNTVSTVDRPTMSAAMLAPQVTAAPLANIKPKTAPPIMPLRLGKSFWAMTKRML